MNTCEMCEIPIPENERFCKDCQYTIDFDETYYDFACYDDENDGEDTLRDY